MSNSATACAPFPATTASPVSCAIAITWASYNLPTLINGSDGNSSQFVYGPERQRWKQQASFGGTIEETLYIGGVLEKVTREGVTSWRHHIAGATGEVAIHTRKNDGTSQTHYLSRDHLGSVDAVSNGTGAVEVRTAFNAYGQRRNAAGWSGAPTAADLNAITGISREGYTGHDMLDNLNLTHMNGRVYDQVAGRFLSADPFVQNPFDSQSLNRYSYVSNNPLSFTDPTGFQQAGPDDRPEPPRRGGVVPNNERVRGTGSPGGGCKAEACLPRGYTPEEDAQFQQEYQIYLKNPVAFDQQARGSAVGGTLAASVAAAAVRPGVFPGISPPTFAEVQAALKAAAPALGGIAVGVLFPNSTASDDEITNPPLVKGNVITDAIAKATARGDAFITSYKAPTINNIAAIQNRGFTAADFRSGAYFSFNPASVLPYANAYGQGSFVINTRLSEFQALAASGQIIVDGLVPQSFTVLPGGLVAFTRASTIIYVPPTSREFYEIFLK